MFHTTNSEWRTEHTTEPFFFRNKWYKCLLIKILILYFWLTAQRCTVAEINEKVRFYQIVLWCSWPTVLTNDTAWLSLLSNEFFFYLVISVLEGNAVLFERRFVFNLVQYILTLFHFYAHNTPDCSLWVRNASSLKPVKYSGINNK